MKRILIILTFAGIIIADGCNMDGLVNGNKTIDGWTISTIDKMSAGNDKINAVCDDNNKLHVCYTDSSNNIKYATNKSGSWVKITLAPEAGELLAVKDHGIAIDSNNKVHIVYATETNEIPRETNIYYLTDKSGSFQTELIYSATKPCSRLDIAATADGHVHIVFGDENLHLIYKNNLSGSWSTSQIDSYVNGVEPSLALDADENLFLAYNHAGERALKLQIISAAGKPVSNKIIDNSGDTGSPSICINKSNGAVYIFYWDYLMGKTKLYNNGIIEEVENNAWSAGGLTLDRNENPHMTYTVGNVLKLAKENKNKEDIAINILPDQVSSTPSDIVIDSTGKIYVVYPSRATHNLCVMSM